MTTDDRAEKLALAIYGYTSLPGYPPAAKRAVTYAARALAAVDADPAAYGYRKIEPPEPPVGNTVSNVWPGNLTWPTKS